jgi:hypothetical protein
VTESVEREIQDYLDGRMSDEERRAFETRLATDDVLAKRVREERKLGEALRADLPELGPGFYQRLRTRFEERAGSPARPTRAFRFLSWEAAGLVAAVALVVAVFLPILSVRDARDVIAPSDSPAPVSVDDVAGAKGRQPPDETRDEPSKQLSEGQFAPAPEAIGEADDRAAPSVEPRAKEDADLAPALRRARAAEPASPEVVGSGTAAEEKRESPERFRSLDESAGMQAPESETAAGTRSDVAAFGLLAPSTGRSLPDGLVGVGETREIADPEEWERLDRRLGGTIGAPRPGERLVLHGTRGAPVRCEQAVVEASDDAWRIHVSSPAQDEAGSAACLFRLPDDGRIVRFVRDDGDEP